MKPVHVKPSVYIDFNKENNKESPEFKVGDHVRISKYTKSYAPNWSGEVFVIKNTLLCGYMLLVILKAKKLLEHFLKKNYKKQGKKNLG